MPPGAPPGGAQPGDDWPWDCRSAGEAAEALRAAIGLGAGAMPGGLCPRTWIDGAVLSREDDSSVEEPASQGDGWGVSRYSLGQARGWVETEHAVVEVAGVNCDEEACSNEGDGTGSTMWPGAFALVEHLLSGSVVLAGQRVLELGAGVGLCGLAAARLGASVTTLSDASKETLKLLRSNLQRNTGIPGATTVELLPFGQVLPPASSSASFSATEAARIFDLILGSELAYGWFGRKFADELFSTVDRSLAPDGVFVLSYCARGASVDGPAFSAHVFTRWTNTYSHL